MFVIPQNYMKQLLDLRCTHILILICLLLCHLFQICLPSILSVLTRLWYIHQPQIIPYLVWYFVIVRLSYGRAIVTLINEICANI